MTSAIQTEGADWLGLANRVCVVTGGGSGIGAEIARQFAIAGACVAVLDRDEKGAADVASAITSAGGRAIAVAADVTRPDSIEAAAARVERELGACQVLVNNAAILQGEPLLTLSLDKWNQLMSVNLTGALVCAQKFAAQMIASGHAGSIVNIASITGHLPMPSGGGYSVSKAGLMMLSRLLTVELAAHRIRSNVVSPALVRTPFSEYAYRDPEVAQDRLKMIPAGRISVPEDIANAVMFLASDRSSYIQGQDILVDGGLTQTLMGLIPRPTMPQPAA